MKKFAFHTEKFETDDARTAAAILPARTRQEMIAKLLFEYALFTAVSDKLSQFHRPVEDGRPGSGWVAGILGESRSGKSFICQHYAGRFPPYADEEGEVYPVVYLEVRHDWTPYHMGEQIFTATGAKSVPSLKVSGMITAACRRLVNARTELVIIDDAHFVVAGTKGIARRDFHSLIKAIADLDTCNVVLSGLPELQPVLEQNAQLVGRGDFPHWNVMPLNWAINEEQEQFRLLLNGIDMRLPFRRSSGLNKPGMAADFYHCTNGMIGRVMNLVKAAGYQAINDGSACIMEHHLQTAALERMRLGETYIPFSGNSGGAA